MSKIKKDVTDAGGLKGGEVLPFRQRSEEPEHNDDGATPEHLLEPGKVHEAIAEGVRALVSCADMFLHARRPVTVVGTSPPKNDDDTEIKRETGAPVIVALTRGDVLERLARKRRWIQRRADGTQREVNPPKDVVAATLDRADWPGARELAGIVTAPVLRADGTVVATPGYDFGTGLFYAPAGPVRKMPDAPTHDDATRAARLLLAVVDDFRFAGDADRSTWLAAVLAMVGRPAYDGNAPLFEVGASTAGTGKSLLCDVAGVIATGRLMPRSPYVSKDDELRKRIFAHVLAGDVAALMDNVPNGGRVGWPALDMALTAGTIQDRVLGVSENRTAPCRMTWWLTGNNLSVVGDTARRTLRIRLEADTDRPEERSGFAHDPLLPWVRENRAELLAAALTLLRAYVLAERPRQSLVRLGSFEGFSALVCGALVWAGLPDPGERLASRDPDSDPEAAAHVRALAAWLTCDPGGRGMTAAEACKHTAKPEGGLFSAADGGSGGDAAAELREALAELSPPLKAAGDAVDPRALSLRLRALKGRWRCVEADGLERVVCFDHAVTGRTRTGAPRWRVRTKA